MNNSKLTRTERQKDRRAIIRFRRHGDAIVGADVLGGSNDFDGGCGGGKDVVIV